MCTIKNRLEEHRDDLSENYLFDINTHLTSGARDDLGCGVEIGGVEILHLLLSDRLDLGLGDSTNLHGVRLAGALLLADGLEDKA